MSEEKTNEKSKKKISKIKTKSPFKKVFVALSQKKKEKREEAPDKKKQKKLLKIIALAIAGLLIIFLTTVGALIYTKNESVFVKRVAQVFPYPAAIVDLGFVSAYSYIDQVRFIKKYHEKIEGTDFNSEEGERMLSEIRKEVMSRLIEDSIIAREARKMNIKISDEDATSRLEQVITSNGGEEEFANILNEYYGLTINEFKNKIFRPGLLREELAETINKDENISAAARAQAEDVYKRATAENADFAALAREFSQDPGSSANGGDKGFFKRGREVPEFDEAAFKLKSGEISKPVRTVHGYHIIKVNEIRGEEIKASHILIQVRDFNEWLSEKRKELEKKRHLGFIPAFMQLIRTN